MRRSVLLAGCWALAATALPARAGLVFQFDYTYDTGGFFTADAKKALAKAAEAFTGFTDQLSEIKPAGDNSWTVEFDNPGTGAKQTVNNLAVGKNTLVVYVGARDLADELARGGFGGYTAGPKSTNAFKETLFTRGQKGALGTPPTDFGPWGGAITFDTKTKDGKDRAYSFDPAAGPAAGKIDFLSVATHELAHVLGFGLAPSWDAFVKGSGFAIEFEGPTSKKVNGGSNVDLQPNDPTHWGALEKSPGVDGTKGRTPLMIPETDYSQRVPMTQLDYAGLRDVGWEVPGKLIPAAVPEPSVVGMAAAGAVGLLGVVRRCRRTAAR